MCLLKHWRVGIRWGFKTFLNATKIIKHRWEMCVSEKAKKLLENTIVFFDDFCCLGMKTVKKKHKIGPWHTKRKWDATNDEFPLCILMIPFFN